MTDEGGEEKDQGNGGLYLANSGLEDNLGLVCELHSQTNWKLDTHKEMIKVSLDTHTHTHMNIHKQITCR